MKSNRNAASALSQAAESLVELVDDFKAIAQNALDEAAAAGEQGVESLKERTDAAVTDAQKMAGAMTDETKRAVSEQVSHAKHQAEDQAQRQKLAAAERLDQISEILHRTGKELHAYDEGKLSDYAEAAAEQIDQLSARLKKGKKRGVMGFIQDNPALIAFAALVIAGVIGKKFMKGSKR